MRPLPSVVVLKNKEGVGSISTATFDSAVPPSSSPLEIYRSLHRDVTAGDAHSSKVVSTDAPAIHDLPDHDGLRIQKFEQNATVMLLSPHIIVAVLVLDDPWFVILARGCRAENPGLFWPSWHQIRDSLRAPDTRAGMTYATAPQRKRCN